MARAMNPDAYVEMADTEARHWWFAGRRAVSASLIAGLKLPREARILEVGSGTGGNLAMLASFGTVSALEMNATARAIAARKTGGRFDIRAGLCPADIPFAGETFDLICLFDVLEHIDEDVATLAALKERLAANGRILLTVPANDWLWSTHDEFLHHKRRYSAAGLRAAVTAAGLRLDRMSYFNTLLFPLAALVRLKDRLLGRPSTSGRDVPARPVNWLLRQTFGMERFLLRLFRLPFGVSLFAILRAGE
jgi:SAM-dependent methyltransferase